jgi:hypothetical protein
MPLLTLDNIAPNLIGIAWLSLLLLYIIAVIAFMYFYARFLRASLASEDARGRRNMAALSGLPFYALCFLFLLDLIDFLFFPLMMHLSWPGLSLCLFCEFRSYLRCLLALVTFLLAPLNCYYP